MCFVDQKDESFYTVSWACNIDGTPFVVAGGINGIIRVIDASNEKIHKVTSLLDQICYFYVYSVLLKTAIVIVYLYLVFFRSIAWMCMCRVLLDMVTR